VEGVGEPARRIEFEHLAGDVLVLALEFEPNGPPIFQSDTTRLPSQYCSDIFASVSALKIFSGVEAM